MKSISFLQFILLVCAPGLLNAAPQKRSCHFSPYTYNPTAASSPTSEPNPGEQITIEPVTDFPQETFFDTEPVPTVTLTTVALTAVDNIASEPDGASGADTWSDFIPTKILPVATSAEPDTPIVTDTKPAPGRPIPTILLEYPSTTITLTMPLPNLTLNLTAPFFLQSLTATESQTHSSSRSPSHLSSHAPTTFLNQTTVQPLPTKTTPTSTSYTFTTPDLGAMQTAYYYNVCSWEEHLDDAICLGGNSMMCCRSDNEMCSPVLKDGGLSCQGIESGNWASVWTRPTVTVGVAPQSTTSTSITAFPPTGVASASSTAFGAQWRRRRW